MDQGKKINDYSEKFIQKIIKENLLLSEQVKRLVKTEYALYNTQMELDKQIILYRALYDIGKKLSTILKKESIFKEMGNFIIDQLNYGGFLLLERHGSFFKINEHGGCCKKASIFKKSCSLDWILIILNNIRDNNGNHILTENIVRNDLTTEASKVFGFFEFAMYSFYIERKRKPSYILIVGNPQDNEYYNKIIPDDITMIGLGNLVSLTINALSNVIHYQQLVEERKSLEKKVNERTEDLNKALKKLKNLNTRLNSLSLKDELTGLYNRRGFYSIGEQCFEMAKRNNTNLLVLFCDVDKLKFINDFYGHKEGDFVIKQTSIILKKIFRNSDIICRFGGDEFVILLNNTTEDYYNTVKLRFDKYFLEFNARSKKKYKISLSCGHTSYINKNEEDILFDDLIEKADMKLYEEKKRKLDIKKDTELKAFI